MGIVAVAAASLAATGSAVAAPADLDPSFGQGGVAEIDFGSVGSSHIDSIGNALVLQPDGKTIAVGFDEVGMGGGNAHLFAERLTSGGAPDPTWGSGGRAEIDPGSGQDDFGTAAVLQPDGKLVVAGSNYHTTAKMLVGRFLPNGTLDPSFGLGTGVATTTFMTNTAQAGYATALRSNGDILVAGTSTPNGAASKAAIAAFTPSGLLDTTFAQSGEDIDAPGTFNAVVSDDPYFLGFGEDDATTPAPSMLVDAGALSSSGASSVDGTFLFGGAPTIAYGAALQPDHKVVVVGSAGAVGARSFAVLRVDEGGSPDPSFGSNGKVDVQVPGDATAQAVAVAPDGKIVIVGTTDQGSTARIAIVRLLPDGSPDPSFGTSGIQVLGLPAEAEANAVVIQPDGRIVIAGSIDVGPVVDPYPAPSALLVLRLMGDYTPPASGATSGGGTGGNGTTGTGGTTGSGPGGTTSHPKPRHKHKHKTKRKTTKIPRCDGHKATIIGTNHADHITGTTHADVIAALGGNDTINGRGGNDIICAGAGNDTVNGGAGNDTINGGPGHDIIDGGPGHDRLTGGPGRDSDHQ